MLQRQQSQYQEKLLHICSGFQASVYETETWVGFAVSHARGSIFELFLDFIGLQEIYFFVLFIWWLQLPASSAFLWHQSTRRAPQMHEFVMIEINFMWWCDRATDTTCQQKASELNDAPFTVYSEWLQLLSKSSSFLALMMKHWHKLWLMQRRCHQIEYFVQGQAKDLA